MDGSKFGHRSPPVKGRQKVICRVGLKSWIPIDNCRHPKLYEITTLIFNSVVISYMDITNQIHIQIVRPTKAAKND